MKANVLRHARRIATSHQFKSHLIEVPMTLHRPRTIVAALLIASFSFAFTSCAHAQDGLSCGSGLYSGLGFGYGFRASPYTLGQVPVPPYFALHPPVYYSGPVARPYGYSPFAYPGSTPTPDVAVEPQVIDNPYCAPTSLRAEAEPAVGDQASVAKPKLIENPFLTQNPESVPTALAKLARN